jgi:hypothetical protein
MLLQFYQARKTPATHHTEEPDMTTTTAKPHIESVKYQYQTVAKLIRAVDRQQAAIASGDLETVAKIGRRLYSNDKALKHRAYSAGGWLNRYVLGGEFGDRSDGRAVGYLGSVDDLRRVLRGVNVYYNLGRSAYRG